MDAFVSCLSVQWLNSEILLLLSAEVLLQLPLTT